MSIEIKRCEPEKLKEAAEVTTKVFEDTFLMDVIAIEEEFKLDNIRVLYAERGEMASVVCVSPRKMYFSGAELSLGGIGGVATLSNHRRKGYAGKLNKNAIDFMKEEGYDISVLYPFSSEYYAKFGYRDFITPFGVIRTENLEQIPETGYNVRKFEEKDLDSVEEIYDSFNYNKIGPVVRNKIYWIQKNKKNEMLTDSFFVAIKNEKVVGYAILNYIKIDWSAEEKQLKIGEIGYLEGEEMSVHSLIKRILSEASNKGYNRVFYDIIDGVDLKYGELPNDDDKEKYNNLKQVKMYKIINLKSILREITPVLNIRIREKKSDSLSWEEFIKITHKVKDYQGSVEVLFLESQTLLKMDEGEFVKLLLGLCAFNKLQIENGDALPFEEKDIINILFPECNPVYWDYDYL